jgi:hypothetical protein
MDLNSVLTAATAVGTGLGGFVGGRLTAKNAISDIASSTVEMLQTQVSVLQENKEHSDAELVELRARVTTLEELVTQRAEVAELSSKVDLVKTTVERIADRVGA